MDDPAADTGKGSTGSHHSIVSGGHWLAPGAAQIGAFFDMDNTLLSTSSGMLYLRYLRAHGLLSRRQWAKVATWAGLYFTGVLSFPAAMTRLMVLSALSSEAEAWHMSADWYYTLGRHYIADGGREQIAWHQAQGHHVAIVSASTPYAVRPVAHELGLGDAYVTTRIEVVDGYFTGRVLEPACIDDGKLILAREYAERHGIDLAQSYFYSDSHHDLSLLEAVAHPVAVNPGRRLARIAVRRGWPVVRFY
jgi:putative phosphoserine phosphatase/1-acylglycerol-3-phosphate O-acyltransferase